VGGMFIKKKLLIIKEKNGFWAIEIAGRGQFAFE
jgi:hypothetical protein